MSEEKNPYGKVPGTFVLLKQATDDELIALIMFVSCELGRRRKLIKSAK